MGGRAKIVLAEIRVGYATCLAKIGGLVALFRAEISSDTQPKLRKGLPFEPRTPPDVPSFQGCGDAEACGHACAPAYTRAHKQQSASWPKSTQETQNAVQIPAFRAELFKLRAESGRSPYSTSCRKSPLTALPRKTQRKPPPGADMSLQRSVPVLTPAPHKLTDLTRKCVSVIIPPSGFSNWRLRAARGRHLSGSLSP